MKRQELPLSLEDVNNGCWNKHPRTERPSQILSLSEGKYCSHDVTTGIIVTPTVTGPKLVDNGKRNGINTIPRAADDSNNPVVRC
jgi:hypothetical protein